MNRFSAFLVHLGISLVIFVFLAWLVVRVWYPDFFFATDGGWQGIRIIVLVNLVLGPLLTLIVYKRGKPGLRRDLTLIGLFQAVCLTAGTWVVYSERPVALVYSDGRFFSMTTSDFRDAGADPRALAALPGPWPKRAAVMLPSNPEVEAEIRGEAFRSGRPVRTLIEHFEPLSVDALAIDRESASLRELQALDTRSGQLPVWLERHGGSLDDYAFFPFATRYEYLYLGVDRADGRIVGLLRTQGRL